MYSGRKSRDEKSMLKENLEEEQKGAPEMKEKAEYNEIDDEQGREQ